MSEHQARAGESEDRGRALTGAHTRVRWIGVCHCAYTADWLLQSVTSRHQGSQDCKKHRAMTMFTAMHCATGKFQEFKYMQCIML